ncbi:mitogen-activated protein kinase kinase kinase 1-like isoform X2 [Thrips palmi]|uniref:Mitogen-activated protein kinase kinase kinase 1-like isoform X2 n=1 Tax=Thrips palmi TaxID=161013 RepID=A0A6P8Y4S2_THRPL|nr:mitogen-activated protein kinase kinase kinase 1-like isoform X2 [Thrips palmi]
MEAVRRRVRRVQQARLYLLQQPGPNSFLVGGDSPEHKYRVVIGPQTCSCGRGPHCLHLLFVMLRVFQIPELDARIYSRELKNFEVESLFQKYRERLNLRVNNSMCLPAQDSRNESGPCSIGSNASSGFGSNGPSCANTQDSRIQSGSDVHSTSLLSPNIKNEEDLCPICLLDMVDGESLVTCNTGCRNRLHHHCMAIWALECTHQGEPILCPLCRQVWTGDTAMTVLPMSPTRSHTSHNPWANTSHSTSTFCPSLTAQEKITHSYLTDMTFSSPSMTPQTSSSNHLHHNLRTQTVASSPVKPVRKYVGNCPQPVKTGFERRGSTGTSLSSSQSSHRSMQLSLSSSSVCSCLTEDVTLPHTEAIPPEQLGIASEWIKVFGVDLICCLYSRDWKAREIAFRRLKSDVSVAHLSDNEEYQQRVLSCCARILAVFAADPVYKVYEAWVRCLQVMLNHARCRGAAGDAEELQRLVRPIVRALLLKCADCNRRTSQLSIDVLLELAKGQEGDLAIGSQLSPSYGMDEGRNLSLVLSCILEECAGEVSSSNWQSLAGRLVMLERLLHTFQADILATNPSHSPICAGGQRLVSMLEFCANALRSPHVTVNRLARHLFVALVKVAMDVAYPMPIQRARQLISTLEPTLQARLRKMIQNPVAQSPVCDSSKRESTPTTPQMMRKVSALKSDVSPARSNSFQGNSPSLPPKPSRLAPTATSAPRPRDLDLSRTRTKRPVKFQNLPGIGGTSNCPSPSPVTPLLAGNSQKRCGPTQASSGSRLVSLFKKNNKSEDISVLPTKPACIAGSPVPDVPSAHSLDRRLLEDCCADATLWSKNSKVGTPSAPNSTPVKGSLESNPGIVLYHPPNENVLDKEQDEEIVVPLVFDEFDFSDGSSWLRSGDLHSSAFYPHEQNLEVLNKGTCKSVEYYEQYREGSDWVRGPLLGRGAFSSCYQAWDMTSGTIMAVKQVSFCRNSLEEQDRVENAVRQELEVLKTLRHENIVRMIGATRQSTHFSMFVEWMAGGSVSGLLERYGAFSERVILNYTQQVLTGLSYLHHKHILHRDLKGANLLVDSTGKHLRIGDLGTAAQLQAARTLSGEFQGQLLGTIAFMAPEVLRGEDYGRSCDIWSVGCCMIEMATTRPPWRESNASNHLALMYKIACSKDPPRMPDSLQGAARQLALDCLQVNSDLRPSAKMLLQTHPFSSSPSNTFTADSGESNFDSGFYCCENCPEEIDSNLPGLHDNFDAQTLLSAV